MGKTWNIPVEWNAITERVIGAAIEVHRELGRGLLEKVYERALIHELQLCGLRVQNRVPVWSEYKGIELPRQELDIVVEPLVVLELKAVRAVEDWMVAQMLSQMRFGSFPLGLLINFHSPMLKDGAYRRVNGRALPKVVARSDIGHADSVSAPSVPSL